MDLILFRHGIAEERGSKDEYDRELTEEGQKKTERAAKVIRKVFSKKDNLLIWSSPLKRTFQTADILRSGLGLETVEIFDHIAEGDLEQFEIQLNSAPDDAVIIVVGHSPDLDNWVYKMTGLEISLKKGGAVGIHIQDEADGNLVGEVTWVMQPKGWKRFGLGYCQLV